MSKRFPKTLRNSRTIIISPNSSDGSLIVTGVVFGRSCKQFKHAIIIESMSIYQRGQAMYHICVSMSKISLRLPIRILLVQYFLSTVRDKVSTSSLFCTLSHITNLFLTKLARDHTGTKSALYLFGTDFVEHDPYCSRLEAEILLIYSSVLANKM